MGWIPLCSESILAHFSLVDPTDQSAPRLVPLVSPDRRCVPATCTPGTGPVRLS